jgi:hypothetical protein
VSQQPHSFINWLEVYDPSRFAIRDRFFFPLIADIDTSDDDSRSINSNIHITNTIDIVDEEWNFVPHHVPGSATRSEHKIDIGHMYQSSKL